MSEMATPAAESGETIAGAISQVRGGDADVIRGHTSQHILEDECRRLTNRNLALEEDLSELRQRRRQDMDDVESLEKRLEAGRLLAIACTEAEFVLASVKGDCTDISRSFDKDVLVERFGLRSREFTESGSGKELLRLLNRTRLKATSLEKKIDGVCSLLADLVALGANRCTDRAAAAGASAPGRRPRAKVSRVATTTLPLLL